MKESEEAVSLVMKPFKPTETGINCRNHLRQNSLVQKRRFFCIRAICYLA
jgi:hypothetical protein